MPLFHEWVSAALATFGNRTSERIHLGSDVIKIDDKGREYIEYIHPAVCYEDIYKAIQVYENLKEAHIKEQEDKLDVYREYLGSLKKENLS